jgi:hypothetical protein
MFVAALYHDMNFVEAHFHAKPSIQGLVHYSVVSEWITVLDGSSTSQSLLKLWYIKSCDT